MEPVKIGVYVCHCGENVAGVVDVGALREYAEGLPDVAVARDYLFVCSDPGQELIKQDIQEGRVNRVVVAACTPKTHEPIFRRVIEEAGLNKYLYEQANIRDQCSWPHRGDPDRATEKAKMLVAGAVARLRLLEPLVEGSVSVVPRALVIGGGIAGMNAARDLADRGFRVYLVERGPSIGGRMIQLDRTFPTNDCSQCIITPIMVEVKMHPNIELLTYSEVESVEGTVGDFRVKVRKKQTYVDWAKCTGCGACTTVCPKAVRAPNEFNDGLDQRAAMYIAFPQAVPRKAVHDPAVCINCFGKKLGKRVFDRKGEEVKAFCERACAAGAIDRSRDWNPEGEVVELSVGTIIVATGYDPFDKARIREYSPENPNVVTALQYERLMSATGPTLGEVKRPSDGRVPEAISFISCVGSRDERFHTYCSKVCCMYMVKQARLTKEKYPETDVYVHFMDMRTPGKDFEEYYGYCRELGVHFIRGRVAAVEELPSGRLRVRGDDADLGAPIEVEVDLVVLAVGLEPTRGTEELAKKLNIPLGPSGFYQEIHPKLKPVSTVVENVFIAGVCQGPKDIPESIAQAKAAASAAAIPMSVGRVNVEPFIPDIDVDLCTGCGKCVNVCPYEALSLDEPEGTAKVVEVKCKGCGACSATCPVGAVQLRHFKDDQMLAQVTALTAG